MTIEINLEVVFLWIAILTCVGSIGMGIFDYILSKAMNGMYTEFVWFPYAITAALSGMLIAVLV